MHDDNDNEIIELTQVVDGDQDIIELTRMVPEDVPVTGNISQEQLDAALERVIEKKFSERIEKILFEVMEKVIQKEIVDIKAGLQKDLDGIDIA